MKIGLIYTVTTPELEKSVEQEIKMQLGDNVDFFIQKNPSILQEANKIGYMTTSSIAKLVTMYCKAAEEKCDAILNVCSSVGEVADASQDLAKYWGVPIVRIDELMCREAVKLGQKIGIMATLPTTLCPTKRTVERVAREMKRRVEIVDILVKDAFGLDQEQFKERLSKSAEKIINNVDVIILAQGSMAYVEKDLTNKYKKPFLGSPRFGSIALKRVLINNGVIKE